jgi:hypothetical protein
MVKREVKTGLASESALRARMKTKEERLSQGMKILIKLRELRVPRDNEGFEITEKTIRKWIEDGLAVELNHINFFPFDREGFMILPAFAGVEPTFRLRLITAGE